MKCQLCGTVREERTFIGPYCGLCDKIMGDVQAGLAAEFTAKENFI